MYIYSFAAEFLSLIISVIITAFTYEKKTKISKDRTIFLSAVITNIVSIFLDFFTLFDMKYAGRFSKEINYGVNSLYFASCFLAICLYCIYLVKKILSHVYEEKVKQYLFRIIIGVTVVEILMLLVNCFVGFIFYFSEQNEYIRGPFWLIGYLGLGTMLVMLAFCFKKYYTRIDYEGRKFLYIGIPVTFMLFIYQIAYPECLLNGTIGAFAACLCYLCFESHREEMDAVTKLGSLAAFLNKLDVMENSGKKYHIIVINLKNYGNINTSFGFSKGNELLYHLATWLQNWFQEGEVYRFAPVSFGVILPYEEKQEGKVSQRLIKLCQEFPRKIEMEQKVYRVHPFFVELLSEGKTKSGTKVMEELEYGIQIAKNEEREVTSFDAKMRKQLERKKFLTEYLIESMEKQRFEMWYQPIYCPETDGFLYAEALMRLKDQEGKYISPEEFIPVAEEIGVISRISLQTMNAVVKVVKDAEDLGIGQVSVNLSMQQLQSRDYMKQLLDMMKESKIGKERISYEITERMLISRDYHVGEILCKMIEEGYTLLMDDFGTGYSNFSMVLDYPFHKIKIDKSILYSSEKDNYKMITMLVKLFHAYGKKIVVEGVETKEQADALCEIGVDLLQGYYYAKPMPEEAYREFMRLRK